MNQEIKFVKLGDETIEELREPVEVIINGYVNFGVAMQDISIGDKLMINFSNGCVWKAKQENPVEEFERLEGC